MAIQLLSLPTVVGGTTTGYPGLVNTIKDKINELATAMGISALTLSAALGAGSPASDLNTMVAKVNEVIAAYNNTPGAGDGGSGGIGTFPLKSGYDGQQKLGLFGTGIPTTTANGFTQGAKFTIVSLNTLQYLFANGDLGTGDEGASVYCQSDGGLNFRYKLEGVNVATAPVGLTLQPNAAYRMVFVVKESGGNVTLTLYVENSIYPLTVAGTLHKNSPPTVFSGAYVNGAPFNATIIGLIEKADYVNRPYSTSEAQALIAADMVVTQTQYQATETVLYAPGLTETATSTTTANLADMNNPLQVVRFS